MVTLLRVERLRVSVGGREVLRGLDLMIRNQEVHVLFGPNGSGKSTLLATIMGLPRYEVKEGRVLLLGRDITKLKPFERAKLGIAMAFQNPPRVNVKLGYILERLVKKYDDGILNELNALGIAHLLKRNLHHGFSGGEIKRVEMLLTLLQRPRVALLDEPDSGVDVDSLNIIGKVINKLIDEGASILLVTHMGHILRYIEHVDLAHVLIDGRIVYTGEPKEVLNIVLKKGYSFFKDASRRREMYAEIEGSPKGKS